MIPKMVLVASIAGAKDTRRIFFIEYGPGGPVVSLSSTVVGEHEIAELQIVPSQLEAALLKFAEEFQEGQDWRWSLPVSVIQSALDSIHVIRLAHKKSFVTAPKPSTDAIQMAWLLSEGIDPTQSIFDCALCAIGMAVAAMQDTTPENIHVELSTHLKEIDLG